MFGYLIVFYKNLEIIVINDGSTDNSGDNLSSIQRPINYIHIEKKMVVNREANMALDRMTGSYVTFVRMIGSGWYRNSA